MHKVLLLKWRSRPYFVKQHRPSEYSMEIFNGTYSTKGINQATGKRFEVVLSLTQAGQTLSGTYVVRGELGKSLKDMVKAPVSGLVQQDHAIAEIKSHRLEISFTDEAHQQIWMHSEHGSLFDNLLERVG